MVTRATCFHICIGGGNFLFVPLQAFCIYFVSLIAPIRSTQLRATHKATTTQAEVHEQRWAQGCPG